MTQKVNNPFQTLRDAEMGRITVGEAAKILDITPRAVMKRLAAWSGHLGYLEWAYPMLVDKNPPDRSVRGELLEQISAKLGKSRRQVTRIVTEYADLASPQTYEDRKLGTLRKKHHMFNLDFMAGKVVAGLATVPDLMTTSESDGVSRSALYRAVKRMATKFDLEVRELPKLSPAAQADLADQVAAHINRMQNELVRDQIQRDKAAAARQRGRKRRTVSRPFASRGMHA